MQVEFRGIMETLVRGDKLRVSHVRRLRFARRAAAVRW